MAEPSSAQKRFLKKRQQKLRTVTLVRILIFLVFLMLWEASTRLGLIDAFIFSSPARVAETFLSMAADGSIFRHIGITLLETLLSFFLVFAASILAAVLLWMSRSLSRILEPYLVVLNSLPKSALAPLLIVWMGANVKTIITAGISVAIFGSVISIYSSFQSVEPDMLRLIATLGGTKKDMLFRVVLPWSFPGLLAVWKVNIGLCLVGVVIGEFIGAREGLGYLIIYGSQVFRYAHAREGRMTDDWNRMSGRTKRNAVWRTTRFAGPRGNGKNLRTV